MGALFRGIDDLGPAGVDTEAVRALLGVGGLGGGLAPGDFRVKHQDEFGDVAAYARKGQGTGYAVDDDCLLRRMRAGRELFVFPPKLIDTVLDWVHGAKLSGYYGIRCTTERLNNTFWWPGWIMDVKRWIECCVACIAAKTTKPG